MVADTNTPPLPLIGALSLFTISNRSVRAYQRFATTQCRRYRQEQQNVTCFTESLTAFAIDSCTARIEVALAAFMSAIIFSAFLSRMNFSSQLVLYLGQWAITFCDQYLQHLTTSMRSLSPHSYKPETSPGFCSKRPFQSFFSPSDTTDTMFRAIQIVSIRATYNQHSSALATIFSNVGLAAINWLNSLYALL